MGVPGFFLWLMKNFKKNGFVFKKESLQIVSVEEYAKFNKISMEHEKVLRLIEKNKYCSSLLADVNNIDWLLIDANCLIHPKCFEVVAAHPEITNDEKLESKMLLAITSYIEQLIKYINPTKGIYIAIDGVAPVAKIKQQRSRRFKSVADRNLFDSIKKKHNKEIHHFWNNSAITPGTNFMDKLHNHIVSWASNQIKPIIYSPASVPAEGEHKLLQFIRDRQTNYKEIYSIYGLDADLIFLALTTGLEQIYLLREANQFNKSESKDAFNLVSISIMRQSIDECFRKQILKEEESEYTLKLREKLDKDSLINDWVFMCYLLGNDFLPHIPSLDISRDGIEYLLDTYGTTIEEVLIETGSIQYLLQGITVNNLFFRKFIKNLGRTESEKLIEHYHEKKRRMICDGDEYEKEMFRIENLQFKINDPIKLGFDNEEEWRKRYYQHYWDVDEAEIEEFVRNMVKHYLMGLKWVTDYYFDKCPTWTWYYPFEHPPLMIDIAKYIDDFDVNIIKWTMNKPLIPYVQLLCVLPPQSSYLLPKSLQKLMTNVNSSLAYLYPIRFEQDFINKNKYWMGVPLLPPLNINLVNYIFNKYKDELTKEELKRCIQGEIIKFRC